MDIPENVLNIYGNKVKMGIAQILAGENPTGETFNQATYNSLLSSVNNLGYFNSQKLKIVEFIKNFVVGEPTITKDAQIFEYNFDIGKPFEDKLISNSFEDDAAYDDDEDIFSLEDIEKSPRLYKGYSVVIPAIVEQALSNTFAGTTTSLYPYFKRVNMTEGDFSTYKVENAEGEEVEEYTTTGPVSLNAIILQPKKGAIPVGLQLQIDAELKGKETLAEKKNIVVELQVGIEYVRGNPNDPYIALEDKLIPEYEDSEVVTIDARKGCVVETPSLPDLEGDPSNLPTGSGQVDYEADPNSQGLPFVFQYSFYDLEENFPDGQPAFEEFDDGSFVTSSIPSVPGLPILPGLTPTRTPITDRDMFTNVFKDPGDADDIAYNAGLDYIQITFKIVSAKQYSGDGDSELVDYKDIQNILFDISVMPLTY